MRNLIVTGMSPAAVTADRMMLRSSARRTGSADPPPLRVTLGTGQPKFMSTWSTPISPTRKRTASPSVRRSEEHTSELQSLMLTSYAVFCLKKKIDTHKLHYYQYGEDHNDDN